MAGLQPVLTFPSIEKRAKKKPVYARCIVSLKQEKVERYCLKFPPVLFGLKCKVMWIDIANCRLEMEITGSIIPFIFI